VDHALPRLLTLSYLIFAGLPSCMMWPQHGWGYAYMYSALDDPDDLENAKKFRASASALCARAMLFKD
jgi:hypothetical protein